MDREQPYVSQLEGVIPFDRERRVLARRFIEEMSEVDFEGVVASMNIHPLEGEDLPLFFVVALSNDPDDVSSLERKVHWIIAETCADGFQEKRLGEVAVLGIGDFMAYKRHVEFVGESVIVLLEKGPQADLHTFRPGVILNCTLN